jgi:hypothetical protein
METAACAICASSLRAEIERKDIPGKSAEAIAWARKQGVNISKFSLAKHRTNHLSGGMPESVIKPERRTRRTVVKGNNATGKPAISDNSTLGESLEKENVASTQAPVSDLLFLDTVRDMVYKKLLSGEMELKLESGFKAIEIKSKISEESQSEKLLLEILNEIRADELSK